MANGNKPSIGAILAVVVTVASAVKEVIELVSGSSNDK